MIVTMTNDSVDHDQLL